MDEYITKLSMRKTEFVAYLSKKNRRPQSLYSEVLNEILQGVIDNVSHSKNVQLTGFGNFKVQHKKERKVKHVKTQKIVAIPKHNTPYFRPGREFKRAVNKK